MGRVKRHPDKPHLQKTHPNPGDQHLPTKKDSEWYCSVCRARVTDSPTSEKEYGHINLCPHRGNHGKSNGRQIPEEYLEHVCDVCGRGDFENQTALSIHKNRTHDQPANHHKTCEHCQVEFSARRPSRKYCSMECSQKAQQKRVTKECETCGDELHVIESKQDRTKYCSLECKNEGRRLDTRECPECNESFQPDRSSRIYCSTSCLSKSTVQEGFGRQGVAAE